MNNKPVAIVRKYTVSGIDNFHVEMLEKLTEGTELYAYPVKEPLTDEEWVSVYTTWALTNNDPLVLKKAILRKAQER